MASTIGTARGTTQGSCLPFPSKTIDSPAALMVFWFCIMVATGLNATLNYICCPFEIPP